MDWKSIFTLGNGIKTGITGLNGTVLYIHGKESKERTTELAQDHDVMSAGEILFKTPVAAAHATVAATTIPYTIEILAKNPAPVVKSLVRGSATAIIPASGVLAAYDMLEGANTVEEALKAGDQKKLAEGRGQQAQGAFVLGSTLAAAGILGYAAAVGGTTAVTAAAVSLALPLFVVSLAGIGVYYWVSHQAEKTNTANLPIANVSPSLIKDVTLSPTREQTQLETSLAISAGKWRAGNNYDSLRQTPALASTVLNPISEKGDALPIHTAGKQLNGSGAVNPKHTSNINDIRPNM